MKQRTKRELQAALGTIRMVARDAKGESKARLSRALTDILLTVDVVYPTKEPE